MRSPLKFSALMALVLLAFSLVGGTGVGAQDDAEAEFEPSDLSGIEAGVARSYSVDYEALYSQSTPGAEMEMPSGILFIGGMVLEFNDNGNAESGFDTLIEELNVDEMALSEDEAVEEYDVDLGNKSKGFFSVDETDGVETQTVITIVQEDSFIYVISAAGSDVDMKESAKSLAETLMGNDGSGEGEFNADGTSTGGLWDKFPGSDDELFAGLVASDEVIFPEPADDDA